MSQHNEIIIQSILSVSGIDVSIMSDAQRIMISCPQCNYSNAVPVAISKYKEIVYQPCNDKNGEQEHNKKDQTRCENCHNNFDFYWCEGHTIVENDTTTNRSKNRYQ
ncbi:hypothetical protein H7X64_04900 [Armatimonadetes bacterium]|nr:hypothetical protein [bacterium]